MTIDELKLQRRWVNWKLEHKPGQTKPSKVPYTPRGTRARNNDPSTFSTFAECEAALLVSKFDGIGMELGLVAGVYIVGVDLDFCCDAHSGKFTPESREIVIGLDSYSEFSPSGEGAHVWVVATLANDKPIVKAIPGCKQVEVKGSGYYHTFTGRHLSKTPHEVLDRQAQLDALCKRVLAVPKGGITLAVAGDEEARFKKLWAGDMSDYQDNHSVADMALVSILARRFDNNPFKIDEEMCKSGLYRPKWDRLDYKWGTIAKVIKDEPVPVFDTEEPMTDDGIDEYVVNALTKEHEGWFPRGELSIVGGVSGSGKTYWTMVLLEKVRRGSEVWGHTTTARDYRVLMNDRGPKAMRRTLDKLGLSAEAKARIIRLTSAQQVRDPAEVLEAAIEANPGAEIWFIEGLDMWVKESMKMNILAPILDALQRLAARRNIAIIASVGSSKEKTAEGKETERYHGRDVLFGSVVWGRKAETIVLISKTDPDNENCPRQYSVLVRNGWGERFWMDFHDGELHMVAQPEPKERKYSGPPSRSSLVRLNVIAHFKAGERITYSPGLGASSNTYYKCLKEMTAEGKVEKRADGNFYRTQEV
jgi:hypothetical protein